MASDTGHLEPHWCSGADSSRVVLPFEHHDPDCVHRVAVHRGAAPTDDDHSLPDCNAMLDVGAGAKAVTFPCGLPRDHAGDHRYEGVHEDGDYVATWNEAGGFEATWNRRLATHTRPSGFIGTPAEFVVADLVCRAAAEGRNVQADSETWDDDQASAVECFAIQLLEALGWLDMWKAGWIP